LLLRTRAGRQQGRETHAGEQTSSVETATIHG
jgi:hypothetical protein